MKIHISCDNDRDRDLMRDIFTYVYKRRRKALKRSKQSGIKSDGRQHYYLTIIEKVPLCYDAFVLDNKKKAIYYQALK